MKYRIEEAIIIETIETEPHFSVETVEPELISKPKEKPSNFIESMLDLIFDSIDIFGAFGEPGSRLEDELFRSEEEQEEQKEESEVAIIVETHEKVVQEQYFLFYEVVE